jgi:hypothetical protein
MHMNVLRYLLLFAFTFSVFAAQSLTFTPGAADFRVLSTATGSVSSTGPFISVVLDQFTMRANAQYKTSEKVLGYKVGLAFTKPNGQWGVVRWSALAANSIVLVPGDTHLVQDVKFVIPIDGLRSLKDYWLVLAVQTENNGAVGYTYAHSGKGLL